LLLAYQGFERGVATFYDLPGIPVYVMLATDCGPKYQDPTFG